MLYLASFRAPPLFITSWGDPGIFSHVSMIDVIGRAPEFSEQKGSVLCSKLLSNFSPFCCSGSQVRPSTIRPCLLSFDLWHCPKFLCLCS